MKNIFISLSRFKEYIYTFVLYKQKISVISGLNFKDVDTFYKEISNSEWIKEIAKKRNIKRGFFDFSMLSPLRAQTLYVLCRILRPDIVVETGVAEGFSSVFILQALERNNKGRLFSIDLPNEAGQELMDGHTTGWLVSENLRHRWTLIFGSSREKLLFLLDNLKKIDIFYHDSDHSYENMMFEFQLAESYLKKDGFLLSDDITENSAFIDFCCLKNMTFLKLFKLGIAKR